MEILDKHIDQYFIILIGLVILIFTSGYIVLKIISKASEKGLKSNEDKSKLDIGFIIGKCENILIYIFILVDQYTAIGLIFTAKTIVRKEEMEKDPLYYLAGTLINVTYSVIIGILIKQIIELINIK